VRSGASHNSLTDLIQTLLAVDDHATQDEDGIVRIDRSEVVVARLVEEEVLHPSMLETGREPDRMTIDLGG